VSSGGTRPAGPADQSAEQYWRKFLEHPDSFFRVGRPIISRIPTNPRCQLCAFPFAGPGGRVFRLVGKRQSRVNPNMCNSCEDVLLKHHGGAEVAASLLFADIRGSTTLAEGTTPTAFRATLERFYTAAAKAVYAHGGIVDKFVGDELVAAFPPFLGSNHPARAVAAAEELLVATGHTDPAGPWVPLGAGVHTGNVWFGAIGEGGHVEITVVGDVVNTTARLAAKAATGEIIVSTDAAVAAGLDPNLEPRNLELKGKRDTTEVVSLRIGPGQRRRT
jgi:adenylate cyclase